MNVIVIKQGVLFDKNKETNNVQLEAISHQINLIKLKDLNVFPFEEIKRKFGKYLRKWQLAMQKIMLEKSST